MLVSLEGVHKRYGGREGVEGISLALPAGQAVGLLGLNGAGKTTLLKLMAGLLWPDRGRVEVLGHPPRLARARIAYLPERDGLPAWLTPWEAARMMAGLYPDFRPRRYREVLDFLEVPGRPLKALSKGQRARLALALVLAREAPLYLLDEPLGGLDLISRDRILKALVREWREEATLVLSTHEVAEAEGLFDRVLFLREGRLLLDLGAEEVRARGLSVADLFKEVLA